eukprot:scaffold3283_cov237-Pinguiococcus_pyrenoidosus.AAC.4
MTSRSFLGFHITVSVHTVASKEARSTVPGSFQRKSPTHLPMTCVSVVDGIGALDSFLTKLLGGFRTSFVGGRVS